MGRMVKYAIRCGLWRRVISAILLVGCMSYVTVCAPPRRSPVVVAVGLWRYLRNAILILKLLEPSHGTRTGGICCWRANESRFFKSLDRAVCEKSMALIVDDNIDVWHADLGNLCLVRRFKARAARGRLRQASRATGPVPAALPAAPPVRRGGRGRRGERRRPPVSQ